MIKEIEMLQYIRFRPGLDRKLREFLLGHNPPEDGQEASNRTEATWIYLSLWGALQKELVRFF